MEKAPPSPLKAYHLLLGNSKGLDCAFEMCRAMYPAFPENATAMVLRVLLSAVGLVAPRSPVPFRAVTELLQEGWKLTEDDELRTGDVVLLDQSLRIVVKVPASRPNQVVLVNPSPREGGRAHVTVPISSLDRMTTIRYQPG